jgi:hypothetical protein
LDKYPQIAIFAATIMMLCTAAAAVVAKNKYRHGVLESNTVAMSSSSRLIRSGAERANSS